MRVLALRVAVAVCVGAASRSIMAEGRESLAEGAGIKPNIVHVLADDLGYGMIGQWRLT